MIIQGLFFPREKATVSNVRHVAGIVLRIVFLLMSRSSTGYGLLFGKQAVINYSRHIDIIRIYPQFGDQF